MNARSGKEALPARKEGTKEMRTGKPAAVSNGRNDEYRGPRPAERGPLDHMKSSSSNSWPAERAGFGGSSSSNSRPAGRGSDDHARIPHLPNGTKGLQTQTPSSSSSSMPRKAKALCGKDDSGARTLGTTTNLSASSSHLTTAHNAKALRHSGMIDSRFRSSALTSAPAPASASMTAPASVSAPASGDEQRVKDDIDAHIIAEMPVSVFTLARDQSSIPYAQQCIKETDVPDDWRVDSIVEREIDGRTHISLGQGVGPVFGIRPAHFSWDLISPSLIKAAAHIKENSNTIDEAQDLVNLGQEILSEESDRLLKKNVGLGGVGKKRIIDIADTSSDDETAATRKAKRLPPAPVAGNCIREISRTAEAQEEIVAMYAHIECCFVETSDPNVGPRYERRALIAHDAAACANSAARNDVHPDGAELLINAARDNIATPPRGHQMQQQHMETPKRRRVRRPRPSLYVVPSFTVDLSSQPCIIPDTPCVVNSSPEIISNNNAPFPPPSIMSIPSTPDISIIWSPSVIEIPPSSSQGNYARGEIVSVRRLCFSPDSVQDGTPREVSPASGVPREASGRCDRFSPSVMPLPMPQEQGTPGKGGIPDRIHEEDERRQMGDPWKKKNDPDLGGEGENRSASVHQEIRSEEDPIPMCPHAGTNDASFEGENMCCCSEDTRVEEGILTEVPSHVEKAGASLEGEHGNVGVSSREKIRRSTPFSSDIPMGQVRIPSAASTQGENRPERDGKFYINEDNLLLGGEVRRLTAASLPQEDNGAGPETPLSPEIPMGQGIRPTTAASAQGDEGREGMIFFNGALSYDDDYIPLGQVIRRSPSTEAENDTQRTGNTHCIINGVTTGITSQTSPARWLFGDDGIRCTPSPSPRTSPGSKDDGIRGDDDDALSRGDDDDEWPFGRMDANASNEERKAKERFLFPMRTLSSLQRSYSVTLGENMMGKGKDEEENKLNPLSPLSPTQRESQNEEEDKFISPSSGKNKNAAIWELSAPWEELDNSEESHSPSRSSLPASASRHMLSPLPHYKDEEKSVVLLDPRDASLACDITHASPCNNNNNAHISKSPSCSPIGTMDREDVLRRQSSISPTLDKIDEKNGQHQPSSLGQSPQNPLGHPFICEPHEMVADMHLRCTRLSPVSVGLVPDFVELSAPWEFDESSNSSLPSSFMLSDDGGRGLPDEDEEDAKKRVRVGDMESRIATRLASQSPMGAHPSHFISSFILAHDEGHVLADEDEGKQKGLVEDIESPRVATHEASRLTVCSDKMPKKNALLTPPRLAAGSTASTTVEGTRSSAPNSRAAPAPLLSLRNVNTPEPPLVPGGIPRRKNHESTNARIKSATKINKSSGSKSPPANKKCKPACADPIGAALERCKEFLQLSTVRRASVENDDMGGPSKGSVIRDESHKKDDDELKDKRTTKKDTDKKTKKTRSLVRQRSLLFLPSPSSSQNEDHDINKRMDASCTGPKKKAKTASLGKKPSSRIISQRQSRSCISFFADQCAELSSFTSPNHLYLYEDEENGSSTHLLRDPIMSVPEGDSPSSPPGHEPAGGQLDKEKHMGSIADFSPSNRGPRAEPEPSGAVVDNGHEKKKAGAENDVRLTAPMNKRKRRLVREISLLSESEPEDKSKERRKKAGKKNAVEDEEESIKDNPIDPNTKSCGRTMSIEKQKMGMSMASASAAKHSISNQNSMITTGDNPERHESPIPRRSVRPMSEASPKLLRCPLGKHSLIRFTTDEITSSGTAKVHHADGSLGSSTDAPASTAAAASTTAASDCRPCRREENKAQKQQHEQNSVHDRDPWSSVHIEGINGRLVDSLHNTEGTAQKRKKLQSDEDAFSSRRRLLAPLPQRIRGAPLTVARVTKSTSLLADEEPPVSSSNGRPPVVNSAIEVSLAAPDHTPKQGGRGYIDLSIDSSDSSG